MTLEDRCRAFLATLEPAENVVESLAAFVLAETGRHAASPVLDNALPVVLYFRDASDAEEFVAAIRDAKPGMRVKKLP